MTCRAQHNIKPSRFIYSFGIIMMLGACVSAKSPEEMPAIAALSVAHIEPSRDNGASGKVKNEPFAGRKEAEKSLGAECGKSYTYEFLLTDTACYGYLPEKMADFLRNLQPPPYVTRKQHEAYSREKQTFKAIRGLGEHPDFAVILGAGQLWVRSFEGPNPETTVYLVHGAGCTVDCERDTSCPPCFKPLSNYRLFRVMGSGKPQDVTRELMPPAPN